ncbi:alginate O-acetyltransferase [Paraburkholderia terrae]|uniref:Probable alginate O-acetylase AlgI n=1 Tax=Paraburkholderia terrae TaxID=311230 RepID=A0ABM7TIE0_9BURK|nr:alginate O-acetyltransferase [Paraburkholderia terrae]
MVFSSSIFLFAFMPLFFAVYYAAPVIAKNLVVFVGSTLFYAVTGGGLTLILLASIVFNYKCARWIGSSTDGTKQRRLVAIGVAINLLPLLVYKYVPFLLHAAVDGASLFGLRIRAELHPFIIPAGISFYTFHSISYLIDVYKRKVSPSTSVIDFGMYMISFPQLIAGPIVRYAEVVKQIRNRPVHTEQIYAGIWRFVIGLAKKIIIADSVGRISDQIFALPAQELTTSIAWLGVIAYTLQIYYDFSGYSDMAIGMGRMMGFEFPENFNQPYRSHSITEFWRRWHMTLSRWFRDYVYIPLGGNQYGAIRTYVNLFVVFLLCGIWHGAAYTFVVWGLYHGLLLVIERVLKDRFNFTPRGPLAHIVALLLVCVGWVFFRASTLDQAMHFLGVMFDVSHAGTSMFGPAFYLTPDKCVFLALGAIFAVLPIERIKPLVRGSSLLISVQTLTMLTLLIYSASLIAANGFNPFIYFRF